MESLKFKLHNYWSSWDFTFMMYKSSSKQLPIEISLWMGSWFCDKDWAVWKVLAACHTAWLSCLLSIRYTRKFACILIIKSYCNQCQAGSCPNSFWILRVLTKRSLTRFFASSFLTRQFVSCNENAKVATLTLLAGFVNFLLECFLKRAMVWVLTKAESDGTKNKSIFYLFHRTGSKLQFARFYV